ncbi:MAG: hypothetical protein KDD58_04405 [Bdellovibrionales bacterium]|nr:hypothetical protein [Bdellovibrionales bacterium]
MNIIKRFLIIYLLLLIPTTALSNPKIEEEYKNLTMQLIRQFWPEVQLKLSLLPNNYIVYDSKNYREYKNSSGCETNNRSIDQTQAAIRYKHKEKNSGSELQFEYIGCNGKTVFYEDIFIQPVIKDFQNEFNKIIIGDRSFIASTSKPYIVHKYSDDLENEIILIESKYLSKKTYTRFFAFSELMVEIVADFQKEMIQTFVFSNKFNYDFSDGNTVDTPITHSSNPVIHQIEFTKSGLKKYGYSSKTLSEQSEEHFYLYYGQVALLDIKKIFGGILNFFINKLPETQTPSAGLASQRILDELVLIDQKLSTATPADINFVQTMIKSYIQSLQDGTLSIIDKRPQ